MNLSYHYIGPESWQDWNSGVSTYQEGSRSGAPDPNLTTPEMENYVILIPYCFNNDSRNGRDLTNPDFQKVSSSVLVEILFNLESAPQTMPKGTRIALC